jgi:hypothetical protein
MRRLTLTGAAFAGALALVVAGLIVGGLNEHRRTAFSVDVPAATPVARLTAGRPVCQRPVSVPSAFSAVRLWIASRSLHPVPVTLSVRGRGRTPFDIGGQLSMPAGVVPGALTSATANFGRTVSAGALIELCLRAAGGGPLYLFGAGPTIGSGVISPAPSAGPQAASLVFLSPHSRSVLALLPTMLDRAALFRPTWMGAWTYWVLLAGLVAAVLLLGASVAATARADAGSDSPS